MGQHDAGYVLHQLGFPAGMACDEYLVRLCIKMKYLMRKGFDLELESSTIETRGSVNWRKEK